MLFSFPRSYAKLPWAALLVSLALVFAVAAGAAPKAPSASGTGTGLSAVYLDSSGASVSRVDAKVDFAWGWGSPAASIGSDDFSVRWTGELQPRYSETYTLSTVSDDGVRLWVDGRLLIDNWTEHSSREDAVSIALEAGRRYPVRMEFFEKGGLATARLLWSSQSQAKQAVPQTQLYPAAVVPPPPGNTPPSVALTSPADGSSYVAPASVSLAASASDANGSVSRVEFMANGTLVATDTTAPYSYSWTNLAAGSYTLTARAVDDAGAIAGSSARTITVTAAPAAPGGSGSGLAAEYFNSPSFSGSPVSRVDGTVDFSWGTGSPTASIGSDDFSVRWTGELQPRYSETYTLSTVTDDGVRLWVDGQLVINNWSEHSSTEDSVALVLQAGRRYPVKLEFFEKGGLATARLLWSSQSQAKQAVPQTQLYSAAVVPPPPGNTPPSVALTSPADGSSYVAPASVSLAASASDANGSVSRVEFMANGTLVATDTTAPYSYSWTNLAAGSYTLTARAVDDAGAIAGSSARTITVTAPPAAPGGSGSGLAAEYFNSPSFSGSPVSRVDGTVDFSWGTGSPTASIGSDDFSVRWTGELQPRYSETYTLSTVTDDGVRLWVDGQLVINNWSEHSSTEDSASLTLQAGRRYPVKLEFFEKGGLATARLLWSSQSQAKQAVPKTQLYPAATAPPPPPPGNTPPSVALTSPADGSSYVAPASVSLAASASDADGSVSRVEFMANGTLVATDTTAPYSYSWTNVAAGSYTLTARAVDDAGATTTSGARQITVTTGGTPPPGGGGGGASVYLSPSGSDAGSCSLAAPCVSFQRAYQVAAPGAVVEVASGTYPSQVIRAVAGKSGPNVVFREAAGGRVVLGGLRFGEGADVAQGPDFITVKGMETSYWGSQPAPLNQEGVSLHPGTTNIVLEDMDAGNFHVWGARDVTIKGGDWGPCYAVWPVSPNVCGNSKIDSWDSGGIRTGNITIDGAYFHDYRFDDSCYAGGADCHWECLYLNASENVTIKNSKFFGCAIFDVFVTFSGPDAVRGHDNLVLENNWFAAPFNEPSYLSSSRTANAVMLSHCEYSPSDGVDHSGLRVRFNSFAGNASVVDDGTSCTTSGGAYAVGNVAAKTGCIAYLSYRSNLFTTGQGQSGVCDASDRNTGQSSAPYVSDSNSAALDHHLAGAIGSSIADNLVPTTTLGGCPSTDLDGQTRASSGNCDAGSDER